MLPPQTPLVGEEPTDSFCKLGNAQAPTKVLEENLLSLRPNIRLTHKWKLGEQQKY